MQSLCVFAVLSECVECVQRGQCVCGQYVECVFVGCVGCKECGVCGVCVGCMCVSGWPKMAHSPRQEQDPVTPTSSWKTVPRSRALDVSLESLVRPMEQGFGAAKLLQVAKGAPLVVGWARFAQNNNITDGILELNKDIRTSWMRSWM